MLRKVLALLLLLAVVSLLLVAPVMGQDKPNLSIVWFAWPPCDLLTSLVAQYPDANVTVSCVPIDQWHDQIFADFAAQGGADRPKHLAGGVRRAGGARPRRKSGSHRRPNRLGQQCCPDYGLKRACCGATLRRLLWRIARFPPGGCGRFV